MSGGQNDESETRQNMPQVCLLVRRKKKGKLPEELVQRGEFYGDRLKREQVRG